ncbi:hypothetical protein Ddye_023448 [Dipteronia dyeriana]|uniref:Uncharacterized protein n=1 Tax=Dipteronia dyeriana TaxID=168575 RepID=A0AAD9WTE2_9ROSI|nr:hypothetical protein Ddye_023448 [Dipteronia dyeriana]
MRTDDFTKPSLPPTTTTRSHRRRHGDGDDDVQSPTFLSFCSVWLLSALLLLSALWRVIGSLCFAAAWVVAVLEVCYVVLGFQGSSSLLALVVVLFFASVSVFPAV